MDLSGRTVLVTGASSGIGRATAILISELGGRVVLSGRDAERLSATRTAMAPGDHAIAEYDLSQTDGLCAWLRSVAAPDRAVGRVRAQRGSADHAASGGRVTGRLRERNERESGRGSLAVQGIPSEIPLSTGGGDRLRCVRRRPGGAIRQPRIWGQQGRRHRPDAVSRHRRLAGVKIRVNAVAPGLVAGTEISGAFERACTVQQMSAVSALHPLGLGRPRDVAYAIAFLLGDAARWITGRDSRRSMGGTPPPNRRAPRECPGAFPPLTRQSRNQIVPLLDAETRRREERRASRKLELFSE